MNLEKNKEYNKNLNIDLVNKGCEVLNIKNNQLFRKSYYLFMNDKGFTNFSFLLPLIWKRIEINRGFLIIPIDIIHPNLVNILLKKPKKNNNPHKTIRSLLLESIEDKYKSELGISVIDRDSEIPFRIIKSLCNTLIRLYQIIKSEIINHHIILENEPLLMNNFIDLFSKSFIASGTKKHQIIDMIYSFNSNFTDPYNYINETTDSVMTWIDNDVISLFSTLSNHYKNCINCNQESLKNIYLFNFILFNNGITKKSFSEFTNNTVINQWVTNQYLNKSWLFYLCENSGMVEEIESIYFLEKWDFELYLSLLINKEIINKFHDLDLWVNPIEKFFLLSEELKNKGYLEPFSFFNLVLQIINKTGEKNIDCNGKHVKLTKTEIEEILNKFP